jgi:hypothetical protein
MQYHLNPFHRITQERFAAAVTDLHAAIPILQDAEILVELIRITASIGDGHTSFRAWEVFQDTPAVTPDKLIEPSWDAYQAGRDPVMEWILAVTTNATFADAG